jgi:colicin import membrane protein
MTTELKLSTDLIELSQPNALDTFTDREKVDAIIAMVAEKAEAALQNLHSVGLYDAATDEGRAAIKSLAFKVTKSKTALEAIGKDLAKEAKELPKKIDAGRNRFDEQIDALAKRIRAPVTAWEAAEEARKAAHVAKIDSLKGYVAGLDTDQETIRGLLAAAESVEVSPEKCEEFEDGYHLAKENAVSGLKTALAARIKHEADQAELAALREKQRIADEQEAERLRLQRIREREQQIEQEAADRARRETEAALQKEIDAANERAAAIEKAANEERARDAAERSRIAAEEAAEAARQEEIAKEARRKEASKLNRQKVAGEASAALMLKVEGLTEKMALDVVRAIAKKEIPHIEIVW